MLKLIRKGKIKFKINEKYKNILIESVKQQENYLVGKSLEEIIEFYVNATLVLTKGNRREASKILKIGERTLYRWKKEDNHANK